MAWGFDNKFPCIIKKVCLCQNNGSIKPKHRAHKKKGRKHKSHLQVPSQFDAGAYTVLVKSFMTLLGQWNLRRPRVSHISNLLYFVERLNKEDKDTTSFSQCNR